LTATPTLSLRRLTKRYGETIAVRDVELDLARGEFFSLLGPSGCGKTTTLRMIAGLVQPTGGEILIDGRPVASLPSYRRPIAMVFQSYALFPHLTIQENVAFGLKMRKVPRDEIVRSVGSALEMVRLAGFERRYPHELSGGQQQRVALARAAVVNPAVLLLDEPLGALDRRLRDDMQIELRQLQRKLDVATIMVTHDQDEALTLSDRIAIMHEGAIRQIGSPVEIYEQPADPFVANFIGVSNLLRGEVVQYRPGAVIVRTAGGTVFDASTAREFGAGDLVVAALRPERIRLTAAAGTTGVRAAVYHRVYLGRHVSYHVRLETKEPLVVTQQIGRDFDASITEGSNVALSWAAEDLRVFPA